MALLRKRPKLPAQFAAVIATSDPSDRVVAWGTVPEERVVVATPRGLWLPAVGDDAPLRCVGWERVNKATWRDGALTVIEADVVDDLLLVDRAPVSVPMAEPGQIPLEVRRRVDASVVRSELIPVIGGQARVVARRVPGRDGLTWWARLEGSTPDNLVVRDQVQAAIELFRAQEAARAPA